MLQDWSLLNTLQDAAAATGDGTPLETNNYGGAGISLTGTFTGTVTWEGTVDGTNWFAVPATNRTSGTAANTATATGIFFAALPGITKFRARISAYTSGNITVKAIAVPVYSAL